MTGSRIDLGGSPASGALQYQRFENRCIRALTSRFGYTSERALANSKRVTGT